PEGATYPDPFECLLVSQLTDRSTAVVIVNYRTPRLAVDCLRSLASEVTAERSLRVVVTDNLSGDDSVAIIGDAIRANGWTWAQLRPLPRNGGVALRDNPPPHALPSAA